MSNNGLLWSALVLLLGCAAARGANDITVETSDGAATVVTSGSDDVRVELTSPGTFTIYADETTGSDPRDGYVNSITFGSGAGNGDYRVRIAYPVSSTIFTNGARYVGWADINSGSKKGSLGMVIIDGQWGKKVVSGTLTDVDPTATPQEVTNIMEAYRIATNENARFVISPTTGLSGSGSLAAGAKFIVGGAGSNGWNLATDIGLHLSGSIATEGSAPVSASSFTIHGHLNGSITSQASITGAITVNGDLSGSIVANSDGSASTSTGDLNAVIKILGDVTSTGVVRSKTKTVGTTVTGGEILNKIDVYEDFSGTIEAESPNVLGSNAWVRLNVDAALPGTWNSGGVIKIGNGTSTTTYSTPATYNSVKVYYVSHRHADMDGSRAVNNFDTDPFVLALTNPDEPNPESDNYPGYRQVYPWLWESMVYRGDLGPIVSGACTPNAAFNNFDVDCYVNCILDVNNCPGPL